ncbi:MAG: serine--tRNA ligase, partial [Dehalococcoidia bacterium]
MLDIKYIRENPELIKKSVADRHDKAPINEILELDALRRQKVGELDNLRARRKQVSREREKAQEMGRKLRADIQALEEEVRNIDSKLESLLLDVPNPPQPDVPIGLDDDDNVEIRTWGEPKTFDFEPLPHWELGEKLGIID